MKMLKEFWKEEDGMQVVEMVLIIAIIVCIVLIFRKQLISFVNNIMSKAFDEDVVDDLKSTS